jgi:hypothetical protein
VRRVLWCTLDVASLRIDVWLTPQKAAPLNEELGMWVAEECAIYVAWELAKELAESVLIHELAHAGIFAAGTKLGDTRAKDSDVSDGEEDAVNVIGAVLYGALKRNSMLRFPPRPITPADTARVRRARKGIV